MFHLSEMKIVDFWYFTTYLGDRIMKHEDTS